MQQFATRLGQEAAKDFRYDPESDPVMKDIFNKLELLRSRKRRCKSKRLTQGVIILPM